MISLIQAVGGLDTVPAVNGRTERLTELIKQYRALHALHADAR